MTRSTLPLALRAGFAFAAACLLALVFASGAFAQVVRWNPPASVGHGQMVKIELVFEDCAPEGPVELPRTPALELLGEPTESRVFSMVNFETRSTVTLGFPVRVMHAGAVELPSFEVETSEGPMTVAATRLNVTSPTLPGERGQQQPLSEVADAAMSIDDARPFVGQVVRLRFDVAVDDRRHANIAGPIVWDPDPMVIEGWSEPAQYRPRPGRNGVRVGTRGLFPHPGTIRLSRAAQDLNVETEARGGGLFRRRRMRTVTVTADPGTVTVRPLPTPAPEGFTGAVGHFAITSQIAPEQARVGEPLTWTLTLSGQGNWPDAVGLPPRSVPNDIEVIRPRTVRRFEEGALFEGEVGEDLVMIPTRAGRLHLEPVLFVYFDPERERYETIEVTPPPLEILPAAPGARAPATPQPAPVPQPSAPQTTPPPAGVPAPDVGLLPGSRAEPRMPREPVPGAGVRGGLAAAPFALRTWLLGLFAAALPSLAFVAWLGRRRAARADPLASRRAARARLDRLLAEPAMSGTTPAAALLLAWQRESAALLGAEGRAPTEARLERAGWGSGTAELTGVDADAWRRLWREADAVIHTTEADWPADWTSRARSALAATQLRAVPPLAGFRWANLWPSVAHPLIAMLCVVVCAGALPATAERAGLDAYRAGDFVAAAEAMEARVSTMPLDWRARSDLGLAHLQLGEIDAALAETSAAFVLAPNDQRLRWNLAVVSRRAGWIDPAVRELAWGGGAHAIARILSVGAWQASAWGGAAVFWLAIAAVFALRHGGRSPRAAWAVALAGLLTFALCAGMVATWGELADRGAALVRTPTAVRSLPTELVEDQVTVALEAGRVVVTEREFLGWVRVRLANGDLGWVRQEMLSPVYRSRSSLVAPAARTEAAAASSGRAIGEVAPTGT